MPASRAMPGSTSPTTSPSSPNFQIAHLNEGVGTSDFAGQCHHADAVQLDVRRRHAAQAVQPADDVDRISVPIPTTSALPVRRTAPSSIRTAATVRSTRCTAGSTTPFSPVLGWFGGVEGNQRDIRGAARHSRWIRRATGRSPASPLALGPLITGEFGVGHVQQRFVDPTIGTIDGPVLSRPC